MVKPKLYIFSVSAIWSIASGFPILAKANPSEEFEGEVEYVVPVNTPQLRPFNTFYVSRFSVSYDEFSGFSIQLTLPRDLTGGKNIEIDLVQTDRQGNKISFTKDIGTATCEVPRDWDTAKCIYKFNENLREQVPRSQAQKYLEKKYLGDPSLPQRKAVVLDNFFARNSTESVGEAFPKSNPCPACTQGNGVWKTVYESGAGETIESEMELARNSGHYFNRFGSGKISQLTYQGNVASGKWKYGSSTGWLRFEFSGEQFQGTWGLGNPGSPTKGFWNGERVGD